MRFAGAIRKENVGISNDKEGEIPSRRKTKVSLIYANQIRVSRVLRCSRTAKLMASRSIFLHRLALRWGDEGVKGQSNSEIARIPRNSFRASLG